MDEVRDVNIAIDVGHDLEGATVSVFLVRLDHDGVHKVFLVDLKLSG